MHTLEPFFRWRGHYTAEEDSRSPFFQKIYSEFEFQHAIYNFLIHPQWDHIGSETLYIKLLFCDYEDGFAIIELIGEWNDAIENDIMTFKRDFIELLQHEGINKYILIGENVLNFHSSDDAYYEEWFEDLEEEGWVALINFQEHVEKEMMRANIDSYLHMGGQLDDIEWETFSPHQTYNHVRKIIEQRLH